MMKHIRAIGEMSDIESRLNFVVERMNYVVIKTESDYLQEYGLLQH